MQGVDFAGNPLRFFVVAHGLEDAQRFARAALGPQVFAEPVAVVFDDGVGGVEYVAARAVVLFQPDQAGIGEFALKVVHVADIGAAKAVDGLIVVADAEKARRLARKQLQPAVLQGVGVLKFVDQNVRKARLIVLAQRLVVGEQFKAAQQQFGKIDHTFALALRVVFRKEFQTGALPVRGGRGHVGGAQSGFLVLVDEVLQLARRELAVADVARFQQPLDERELVGGIENLERGNQVCRLVVDAQQSVRQPVKGANPHLPRQMRAA